MTNYHQKYVRVLNYTQGVDRLHKEKSINSSQINSECTHLMSPWKRVSFFSPKNWQQTLMITHSSNECRHSGEQFRDTSKCMCTLAPMRNCV